MMRLSSWCAASAVVLLLMTIPLPARQAPNPAEVMEILRTNLPGVTEAQLQTAAVEGLIQQLGPRVWLIGENRPGSAPATNGPALARSEVMTRGVGYLRIERVDAGLPGQTRAALGSLQASNNLSGFVLDLRFAEGGDYAAAAATADLAIAKPDLLLDWGTGSARATAKSDALKLPLVVLVNRQTEGAAEALAAVLREAGAAVLIGTNTAGRAMMAEEFPLANGQRLVIARKGVRLGSGEALTSEGVKPDIFVSVNPEEERRWLAEALKGAMASASTNAVTGTNAANRAARRRINEAELVRARRDGVRPGSPETNVEVTPEALVVRDPALARALDLIEALTVVKQWKSR